MFSWHWLEYFHFSLKNSFQQFLRGRSGGMNSFSFSFLLIWENSYFSLIFGEKILPDWYSWLAIFILTLWVCHSTLLAYRVSAEKSYMLDFSASVQFSSVTQLFPTLCNPINRSTPGLPVHHQLPDLTQTHVHQVDDAIQPSHPLSPPSPPAPNPSQHQSLFQWVNSSHEVPKVLEFQL